jgi:hypothetical protein
MALRRSTLVLLGLAAALLAILAVAPAGVSAASDVLDLKKADFQDTIKKEDLILVEVRIHGNRCAPPDALLPARCLAWGRVDSRPLRNRRSDVS